MAIDPKTRMKLEDLVWKHTHRDYRGTLSTKRSERTIMKLMPGKGTCLVTLCKLTDEELLDSLTKKVCMLVSETNPSKFKTLRVWRVLDIRFYELYDFIANKTTGPALTLEGLGLS